MSSVILLLNSPSAKQFTEDFSPFIYVEKTTFKHSRGQAPALQNEAPGFIILEESKADHQQDIDIIMLLKSNPVYAKVPLLVLTAKHTAEETLLYFKMGVTTCVLIPATADEWLNIIKNISAYWQEAA